MNRITKRIVSIILSVVIISSSGLMSVSAESEDGLSTFISFDYNYKVIEVGDEISLRTILSNGSSALDSAVYASSDELIAAVDEMGNVTAISQGECTITATLKGSNISTSCTINVIDKPLHEIIISQTDASLSIGAELQLTATCDDPNAKLIWVSDNTEVATVEEGLVTAIKEGTATITVSAEELGVKAECVVTVYGENDLTLTTKSKTIFAGNHTIITAQSPLSDEITWKSSNKSIATVDENGVVTGVSSGDITITATCESINKSSTIKLKIKSKPSDNISLTSKQVDMRNGQTYYMASHNYNGYVNWESSDASIATVTRGMITAKKKGIVIISASSNDGKYCCTSVVTIKGSAPIRFTYTKPNSAPINSPVTLYSITDKYRDSVKFTVNEFGSEKTIEATSRVEDGNTYIWSAQYTFSEPGYHDVKASALYQGKEWGSGEFASTQAFVTKSNSVSSSTFEEKRVSNELISLIASFEGFESEYYYDTLAGGIVTTAYGKVIYEGDVFYNKVTQNEAMAYLINDTNNGNYTTRVNSFLLQNGISYNQHQLDALVCFSYNLGTGWINTSDLSSVIISASKNKNSNSSDSPKPGDTAMVSVDDFLNVRSGPGTSYNIITSVRDGEIVTLVDGKLYDGWYKIKLSNGTVGYCSAKYLMLTYSSPVGDLSNIPANTLAAEFLQWHRASGNCVKGLLFRRIDELEVFLFGEYNHDGSKNKHGFALPSCCN
ncbi:MAG: Ig-like domain-containing protein [Clostridia bacterium]|nr:Ig-like domain-containing protein [Clostridia bacterium]